MIRQILIDVILFITPFACYALFLWLTKKGVLHPESWPLSTVTSLVIVALMLMIGSFIVLAQFTGAPADSTYVPAHMENGRFVPGHTQ
jgi:hypothetical protein